MGFVEPIPADHHRSNVQSKSPHANALHERQRLETYHRLSLPGRSALDGRLDARSRRPGRPARNRAHSHTSSRRSTRSLFRPKSPPAEGVTTVKISYPKRRGCAHPQARTHGWKDTSCFMHGACEKPASQSREINYKRPWLRNLRTRWWCGSASPLTSRPGSRPRAKAWISSTTSTSC